MSSIPPPTCCSGRIHARLGEYDRAVETLRHALKLNPSDPETYAGLGDALLWNGETDEARRMLEIATRLDPRLPSQELFNLGAAYFLLAQYGNAAQVFERAVAREDGNPFIHAMLAAIYAKAGRREEAMREVAEVRRAESPVRPRHVRHAVQEPGASRQDRRGPAAGGNVAPDDGRYLTGPSFSPGQFEFALSMNAASCLKAGTRSLNWKR